MAAERSQREGNAREQILRFIQESPSCHLRRIKEVLGLGMGTVQYHLHELEKAGRITSRRQSLRKYYFPAGVFKEDEKQLLEVLSNETARKILMFVLETKNPSQTEIGKHIGISSASISWHVKRLEASGILAGTREGKFKRWRLRGEPGQVIALLRNYYPGLWDRWSNRLAEMFLALSTPEEEP